MFNLFSKPDPKQQQRENAKVLRQAGRELEREKRDLEKEEKKLELEIKKLAAEGNKESCTLLAKQLVLVRKQKARAYAATSKVQSVGIHNRTMGANIKLAEVMGATSSTMADMNKIMRPEKVAADVAAFSKASMKMDMTDEMINDTLDDMLTESGDEEESDNIVTQVLDEIGIEISGKMRQAPRAIDDSFGDASKQKDEAIIAQLSKLKS